MSKGKNLTGESLPKNEKSTLTGPEYDSPAEMKLRAKAAGIIGQQPSTGTINLGKKSVRDAIAKKDPEHDSPAEAKLRAKMVGHPVVQQQNPILGGSR